MVRQISVFNVSVHKRDIKISLEVVINRLAYLPVCLRETATELSCLDLPRSSIHDCAVMLHFAGNA
jgi:hypothetical protein